MTQTHGRARILPLVTCPQVSAQKLVGHRYFVELVSKRIEIQDSRPVPVNAQEIDVLVAEPTLQAIEQLLQRVASWSHGKLSPTSYRMH
ncbi:MAG: hypothetical protein N4J56_007380 [Chroococcidiopsis sp. SAG 2025]|uniref:hypothetical protein n=1 Tax=Chroococcidiopsis sp. SAG 2025 TaxID=171389 RepID=UPI002936F959|nr:hypothetical protein [Chroococcidiopsis sp. SAG 2025]MDV2997675.1 hypothetical protein [Chroococcidiopsis sp. SAG 2025]